MTTTTRKIRLDICRDVKLIGDMTSRVLDSELEVLTLSVNACLFDESRTRAYFLQKFCPYKLFSKFICYCVLQIVRAF
jgi:hypothetical protein